MYFVCLPKSEFVFEKEFDNRSCFRKSEFVFEPILENKFQFT